MHLNSDKIHIDCESIPFLGNVLSKEGLRPDNSKVELIKNCPVPTNQKELQSFMGTVNYLSRFLAFLSDLRALLQSLLRKYVEWIWTSSHQQAFDILKEHVSNDVKLQFLIQTSHYT